MTDPQTPQEWQDAVNGAAGAIAIESCKMYGLLKGGPKINLARCEQILKRGVRKGITPSKPDTELALALIAAINGESCSDSLQNSEPDHVALPVGPGGPCLPGFRGARRHGSGKC
jgi:hypothetical protein